ncbi:MAG: hypothetical protein ACT4PT_14210, partial [Methanobacteriota archaeon]
APPAPAPGTLPWSAAVAAPSGAAAVVPAGTVVAPIDAAATPPPAEPAAPAKAEPAPPPQPPAATAAPAAPGARIVRAAVPKDKALLEAKKKLFQVDEIRLELVPHHVFEFGCDLTVEGSPETRHAEGRIFVDAVGGTVVELPEVPVTTQTPPGASFVAAALPPEETRLLAEAHILKTVSRDVKVERARGNASLIEKRRLLPKKETLAVRDGPVCYVPIWTFAGPLGGVKISGISGAIVEETMAEEGGAEIVQ